MTTYLIKQDSMPITVDEIRAEIGIETHALDLLISAGIASCCIMANAVGATWAISVGDDITRYGKPVSVGEPHQFDGIPDRRFFVDVTYAADPERVAKARRAILRWCDNQDDIYMAKGAI